MAPTARESRRHRRQTVRILVDYQSDEASDDAACSDYATTLGAGGLFIESDDALPPGTILKLRFRLPQSDQLHELAGRVTWRRDAHEERNLSPGMGVQFHDGPARTRLARDLDALG